MELKTTPFDIEQMYVDKIDHLSIIPYYDFIKKEVAEMNKKNKK